nr:LysM peptidoglycan-binding domain-containing protein [uncultured Anaerobutyricum sp.]
MQEISMKTTAQIYDFSELQKKKRQRELREKRPFFITGAVLIISLLSVCFFLYFGDRVVKAQESANDIQYKVVEIKDGDSLWSIAKENMDNTNDSGFTNIYQYIHEIKRCNNMKSNQINAGCYLMVPYYN